MNALYQFIFEYGSGNVTADLALVALSIVIIVQAIFLSVLSRKVAELKNISKIWEKSSQAGKLQRLEDSVHEFRTEVLRALAVKDNLQLNTESSEKKTEQHDNTVLEPEVPQLELIKESSQGEQSLDNSPQESIQIDLPAQPAQTDKQDTIKAKVGIFQGLSRTRTALLDKIKSVFLGEAKLSSENIEELEAQLIGADLGVSLSEKLLSELKLELKSGKLIEQAELLSTLRNKVEIILVNGGAPTKEVRPEKSAAAVMVVMMVGVNGAGKTTTSAKLAYRLKQEGFSPLLVAADTFRAAAVDQLKVWGERLSIPVVSGEENAKPSTVVFDAMDRVKKGGFDVVIIDTAGRLNTQANLMNELSGVRNAISRHIEGAPQEVLLVVDGSSGQNALVQAREFQQATGLTGVIVTKLDGTPKGGSVVAIKSELGIPVRYIGVGEGLEDLQLFDPREFSEALLGN